MGSATDREISCRITKTLLLYVRENNNDSLGPLLDGLELDEEYLSDTDNWVSHEFLHVLYKRMMEILHDENAVFNMALSSDRVKSLGMLDRIIRLTGSPRLIYSQSPAYNKMLKLNGDIIIHELDDTSVLVEDRYHESSQKTRLDCDYTRGILAGIPILFDMPLAQVEEIECQVPEEHYGRRIWEDKPRYGAKGCLYRVRWDKNSEPSFWKQFLKSGIYFKAIRDLQEANKKIQKKYNEVRELASNLQKINLELSQSRNQQDIYLQQLKISEARYRLLAENISDIIWTARFDTMQFTYVSPSVEKMLGFTPAEMLTFSVQEILTAESFKNAMDVLAQELIVDEKGGVDPNRSRTMALQQICKDGHLNWAEVIVNFLRDKEGKPVGILGVTRDINKRMLAEAKLKQNEERLRLITDNMSDVITMTDIFYIYRYVSPSYNKVLGYDPGRQAGECLLDHIHPDDLPHVKQVIDQSFSLRNPGKIVHRYKHADGHYVWLETMVDFIFNEDGGLNCGVFASRDVTERKQVEEERHALQERLQQAEKMEALGTLAGGVAHDLNNVLGVVVGYSELLLNETAEAGKVRAHILNVLQGGQRAAAIVQDLLTLARRGVLTRKVININTTITDYMKLPEFEKLSLLYPDVQIITNLDADLRNILGSPVHLGKTLMNLVVNAIESMPGGGTVTIRTSNQYLDKPVRGYDDFSEGDYVVLCVADTGEGIPASDLRRIFEPFYTKKVMGRSGTGLGLSVVWGTVKDHKGYIDVQSQEGKGTTLTLFFPVSRKEVSVDHTTASNAEYMGRGESILVVDDMPAQRDLAAQILTGLSYRIATAASGEEAVEYLKTRHVDLVILDMIMDPGLDGLDTYRQILKIHPQQKAIIVSGFSETDRVSQAQELGAGTYIKKPYLLENLGLAVRKELDR